MDTYGLSGESLREFSHSFTRGAMDDTTGGASNLLLGQHDTTSLTSKVGYYTGTAASMGAGMLYGSTWLKGLGYCGKMGLKASNVARRSIGVTKTVNGTPEIKTFAKIAEDAKPLLQKIARIGNDNKIFSNELRSCIQKKWVFPKDPKNLIPNAYRDKNGIIYTSDYIRIKPEKHSFGKGDIYNPRHHEQHYHVEFRHNSSLSWKNEKNTYYLKPENYHRGMGTGFLPGGNFPGI